LSDSGVAGCVPPLLLMVMHYFESVIIKPPYHIVDPVSARRMIVNNQDLEVVEGLALNTQ
jgi:hypothetical protein